MRLRSLEVEERAPEPHFFSLVEEKKLLLILVLLILLCVLFITFLQEEINEAQRAPAMLLAPAVVVLVALALG